MAVVGDLVVKRYTHARHLRNKIFKVIGHVPGAHNRIVAINPKGQQSQFDSWGVISLTTYLASFVTKVDRMREQTSNAEQALRDIKTEAVDIDRLFPKV